MHRLKTRPQFQAAMAGGTVSRTAHFALHRLRLGAGASASPAAATATPDTRPPGPGALPPAQGPQALFAVPGSGDAAGEPWLGAMVPKRWARRAVTRNTIKRQIYAVAPGFAAELGTAAHVVRLRAGFDRKQFPSATSDALRQAVRAELLQLFAQAVRRPGGHKPPAPAPAAKAPVPAADTSLTEAARP
jgi:ribonuclease P protein component